MNDRPADSTERPTFAEQTLDDSTTQANSAGQSAGSWGSDSMSMSMSMERSRIGLLEQSRIALVALVDGTLAQLDADTQAMLRNRLRLAAGVLFIGFSVFLLMNAVRSVAYGPQGSLIGFHAGITVTLGVIWLLLTYRPTNSIFRLRLAELLIFGLPMLFFLFYQYFETTERIGQGGSTFMFRAGLWLVLMFTYALFIPNPFRRAAGVIGIMCAAPILLIVVLAIFNPDVRATMEVSSLVYYPVLLVLCAAGSVFGVQTIDTLRHEAYEARQLGQYRLSEKIGAGGMGEVYKAEHQLLKRPCVIKLIKGDKAGDQKVLARFKREVRATSELTHWNTIDIFDYGSTAEGVFYYVMEFLPGLALGEIVSKYGPMPPGRIIHALEQACDALNEAHARKMVHRDIKPGNIFLAERGGVYDRVKLLDFGLVKPLSDEEAMHLTTEGAIIGSPLYMSPEQATAKGHPDARSDIYSLGAVAYYLLTGRPPFEGDNPIQVIMAHAQQEPEPPSSSCPGVDVPADLEKIILKCLSKDPADRFQRTTELREALLQCEAAGTWTREDAALWWKDREVPPGPVEKPQEEPSRVPAGAPAAPN